MIEVIPWEEFCEGIAPLWKVDDPKNIPIVNNPFQIIQYPLEEWSSKIIYFPCKFVCPSSGVTQGYTSIYNISDTILRIRGIYVLPDHRGLGIGHKIWQMATNLFPSTFYRTVGFWREDSAPRFIKYSGMNIVPGTDWFWSNYSQVNMRLLYKDRTTDFFDPDFIDKNISTYGLGGSNNTKQWSDSFLSHAYSYERANINLNF